MLSRLLGSGKDSPSYSTNLKDLEANGKTLKKVMTETNDKFAKRSKSTLQLREVFLLLFFSIEIFVLL